MSSGRVAAIFAASVAAAAVVTYGSFAIYEGSWSLQKSEVGHQYQIDKARSNNQAKIAQNNYGSQEGYISAITNDVANIDSTIATIPGTPQSGQQALIDEAVGIGNQACQEATLLTGSVSIPANMKSWISANCQGGSVSLSSPIRRGSGN